VGYEAVSSQFEELDIPGEPTSLQKKKFSMPRFTTTFVRHCRGHYGAIRKRLESCSPTNPNMRQSTGSKDSRPLRNSPAYGSEGTLLRDSGPASTTLSLCSERSGMVDDLLMIPVNQFRHGWVSQRRQRCLRDPKLSATSRPSFRVIFPSHHRPRLRTIFRRRKQ